MKYDDAFPYDTWNIEIIPGKGDEDPMIHRTRSFTLANQCEYGNIFNFREEFIREPSSVFWIMHARPHWSDPVYYPA